MLYCRAAWVSYVAFRYDVDQPAMRIRLLAPLATASALLFAPAHAQFSTPSPDWARTKLPEPLPYDPSINPVPNWFEVRGGAWQLPLETVHHMVSLVDARLDSNKSFRGKTRAARYAIQFRGEAREERRIVRLAGTCSVDYTPARQLLVEFLIVKDGGECNFDAEYDPVEKRLSYFRYHGY